MVNPPFCFSLVVSINFQVYYDKNGYFIFSIVINCSDYQYYAVRYEACYIHTPLYAFYSFILVHSTTNLSIYHP